MLPQYSLISLLFVLLSCTAATSVSANSTVYPVLQQQTQIPTTTRTSQYASYTAPASANLCNVTTSALANCAKNNAFFTCIDSTASSRLSSDCTVTLAKQGVAKCVCIRQQSAVVCANQICGTLDQGCLATAFSIAQFCGNTNGTVVSATSSIGGRFGIWGFFLAVMLTF